MNKNELIAILDSIGVVKEPQKAEIVAFKSVEDGSDYDVWLVSDGECKYVLKKANKLELEVYSTYFNDQIEGAPRFLGSKTIDGHSYFLMEYVEGKDACRCERAELIKVLDALISLQEKYWNTTKTDGYSFEEALESRRKRGQYLNDRDLVSTYSSYLKEFETLPRTLCHDDLLPFNVIVSDKRAILIDWEIAGILPYPSSLVRFIAHSDESESGLFYLKDEDKAFAIDYYYENLIKSKGIDYDEYRRSIDLFLFYEYCEWIMLGNKFEDADRNLLSKYMRKAKSHLKAMKS